jgi:hypothetical protein
MTIRKTHLAAMAAAVTMIAGAVQVQAQTVNVGAGVMRGNVGDAIWLARVKPGDVHSLTRKYWVKKIDLASPTQKP